MLLEAGAENHKAHSKDIIKQEYNYVLLYKDCTEVKTLKEVDSEHFTLSVTETRVKDLLSELSSWSSREFYTLKQLQSLPRKLSFIANVIT